MRLRLLKITRRLLKIARRLLTVYRSSLITMLKLLQATTKMIAVTSGRKGEGEGGRERKRGRVEGVYSFGSKWWERLE